ncbi:hypothetical protein D3C87_2125940 [compost metagenome]
MIAQTAEKQRLVIHYGIGGKPADIDGYRTIRIGSPAQVNPAVALLIVIVHSRFMPGRDLLLSIGKR